MAQYGATATSSFDAAHTASPFFGAFSRSAGGDAPAAAAPTFAFGAAPSSPPAGGGGARDAAAVFRGFALAPLVFSRADLRALHEKPMREAWARHVAGAVEFVKQEVLRAALAGATVYNNTYIVDAVPCADAVLEAKAKTTPLSAFGLGAPSASGTFPAGKTGGKAFNPLNAKSGLLASGSGMQFAEPCMADIVAALKAVFPDSRVSFVKTAPASGGKDVLTVAWD